MREAAYAIERAIPPHAVLVILTVDPRRDAIGVCLGSQPVQLVVIRVGGGDAASVRLAAKLRNLAATEPSTAVHVREDGSAGFWSLGPREPRHGVIAVASNAPGAGVIARFRRGASRARSIALL